MSPARRAALPLAAGLAAAGLALAILASTVGIGGRDSDVPASPAPSVSTEPAGQGRAVFARMGCGTCHTLAAAGSTGNFGPNLDERLPAHSAESLKATILDPPGAGDFSGMPTDFGERLGDAELDALVRFLLESEAGG
jgi:mono/diheme cytochrome c family protein